MCSRDLLTRRRENVTPRRGGDVSQQHFWCFIWDLQETSQRRANGTSCHVIHATETTCQSTTETSFGVSFETFLRRHGDVLMGCCCYVLLRACYDVPIRRRGDVLLRRLGDVPSRLRWVFYLGRRWDVQRDIIATSPRHLNAGWKTSNEIAIRFQPLT